MTFLCILGSFLKVNVENENIFAWQNSQIIFFFFGGGGGRGGGGLIFPMIFGGKHMRKSESTPLLPHTHSPCVTVYDEKLRSCYLGDL